MHARAAALLASLALTSGLAATASAQYFGQNQVQYRDFDFQILKTQHFDIYYYPEEKATAELTGRLAERWYARLSTIFKHQMKDRQPLMLYASAADFRQTNVVSGLGEGTGGVTEGMRRRIVMPAAGPLSDTSHVLGHELVHGFQYDIAAGRKGSERSRGGGSGFERLPLWFVEGLAEYLSIGPVDSQTAMWLRDAVQSNKLPTLKQLGNPRFFPYRFGHAFWAYVGGRWGDDQVITLFREGVRTGDATAAIKKVLGQDEKTFSNEWSAAVRKTYAGFLEAQKDASFYGPELISKKRGGGELNLGPALSPDGKRIVYLSEKDLFSIDLFLADADTGKVIRKLASTATDAHYDSLQFIESAGAWSADGRRFVQSALRNGRGAFFVIDPDSGRKLQEVEFKDLSEIENPAFTPDGRAIVFSAMQGGLLDLWLYDLQTAERRRLTNDAFAELHPQVSPDGRTVAFTTDRFTTKLDDLDFGNYRIGLLDLATGKVREVPGYPNARNSNPQWSPDGRTLFFLSDVMGGTDLHRVDLASGELRQVTSLRTGVYGITPLSPSLSVARESGRIAYTVREDGKHNIYAIDDKVKQAGVVVTAERIAQNTSDGDPTGRTRRTTADGQPRPQVAPADAGTADTGTAGTAADRGGLKLEERKPAPPLPLDNEQTAAVNGGTAVLPPYNRVESKVEKVLDDPKTGLPVEGAAPSTEQYKSKLGLMAVGQPSIGVGVDRFGSYVGGSTSLYFSDMLGNHNLSVSVQAFGELRDIAGQAVYSNLSRRFDWAVGAGFYPYLYAGGISTRLAGSAAAPAIVNTYTLFRQTDASVFAIGAYPFTRADRFEVQATARRIGFSTELRTEAYDYATGEFLGQEKQTLDSGLKPLYLSSFSGAFVHDTSVFGATSPILGTRARLEAGPTLGSTNYTDVLADLRGYVMPVRPVTLAVRAMHYGRYGGGAEDPRFRSIYLGYPELIRGYGDINASECVPNAQSQCPVYDRLFGSRLLVGNVELRAPLWGLFKGRLAYGPLPIELALFADAGVTWFSGQRPSLFGGSQDLLTSAGAAVRVNLFGFLIGQVAYTRPFQRPGKGWVWEWSLSPGF